MCGIAGYFGNEIIEHKLTTACLNLMRQRGPNHQAVRQWSNVVGRNLYLLHSRLSIIDLDSRANQPMQFGDKWIAQNGELYNYLERREELTRVGIALNTQSDTEVMLAAIDHFGWNVLDRCEGMWAFALYNQQDGSLTLCRDRFGEKPLYLYRDTGGVYFGSEIKFIAALIGHRLEVDSQHLLRYLVNGYKALYKTPNTFFKGVTELPPGTLLQIDAQGQESQRHYWKPQFSPREDMSFDEAVRGARKRLIRSVELRLRADVPLAFCMSGGVDSVSLISIAKRIFNYDVHGFTISNTDTRYEESEMVAHTVKELGIRHTEIPVTTNQFLPRLRELIRHHDAPVYTITYYAHWLLMESIAAHGYRISVSGTAADEMFSGYYDHHLAYLYEVRNDALLYKRSLAAWREHIQPIVRNRHLINPALFIEHPGFRLHIFDEADNFRDYLHTLWHEEFTEGCYADSLMRNRMLNELFHEVIPAILHEDDSNAMYFSIENRSPFLDRELLEFCNTVPTRYLIQNGHTKAVLREAMRGIAPDAVMSNRRKVGFNASIHSFLDTTVPEVRKMLLDDSPIYQLVRRDKIEALLDKKNLPNSESKFLFNFVNAKLFLEEFGTSDEICTH
jgi:asparagine synthase (glutamine-hydrolysing)